MGENLRVGVFYDPPPRELYRDQLVRPADLRAPSGHAALAIAGRPVMAQCPGHHRGACLP